MLEKFNIYFGLKLSFLVFGATVQVRDKTLQETFIAVNMVKLFLQRQRDDCVSERFFVNAEKETDQYNIDPHLQHYRWPSWCSDDGAATHVDKTPQDYY